MPKTDTVRQVDLPRSGSGGSVYIRGGNAGGVSNADTVDGYHASSTPTAGKLLALDASAQFDPSVIEWADVAGAGLGASGDTLVVQYGASATTIAPDDAAAAGSAANASRSDHRHGIAAAAPANNLTVTSANAEGDATSFARSNHTHAITTSANPGAAASILASSSDGYLQLVRLGLDVAPSVALQAQGTTPQLRIQSDASHYATFGADGSGNLTILPSGNSVLLDGDKTLSSDDWASQTTGWGIYPESTHGRSGYADFRYIYADELHVKAFIADLEQALAGGQIISKSVAILAADFTVPAKGAHAWLIVEDLPGTTAYAFANSDWIRIRNISRDGESLVVADCYGVVAQYSQNGDGTQTYDFVRAAADTGSAATGAMVQKGGLALDYGVSGNGFWEVTTLDAAGSPYAQVATWATHPQTQTVRVRLGNLDGIAGIGAEWGLWAGTDVNHQFKASSAGVELRGIPQYWLDGANNVRGTVDPTATGTNALFWLGPSSGDPRFAVRADGVVLFGAVNSTSVAGWAHASDLTKIDGGDIYAGTVTTAALTVNTWNECPNPGFEKGATAPAEWTLVDGTWGTYGRAGTKGLQITGDGSTTRYAGYTLLRAKPSTRYHVAGWFRMPDSYSGTARIIAYQRNAANDAAVGTTLTIVGTATSTTGWFRAEGLSVTTHADCAYLLLYVGAYSTVPNGHRVWFDDLVVRESRDVSAIVGDPDGARVQITPDGIEGYDSTPTKQFYIRASDGRATWAAGKGVLDEDGIMLSGAETTYATYNAVRWLDGTLPAGDEVARVSAGLFVRDSGDTADSPALRITSDPAADYGYSELELCNQPSTATVRQRLLMFNSTEATDVEGNTGAGIRLEAINGAPASIGNALLEVTSGPGDFSLPARVRAAIAGTTRFYVDSSGATTVGNAMATRFASYTGTFTGTVATHTLVAPGNGIYLLSAAPDDSNWRLIEYLRVRSTTVSSIANVVTNYLSLTSSGGTVQIANSNNTAQTVRWCLIRLAN